MKAIQMPETGSPDVLQLVDLPEPEIRSDTQLKIRLKAAGVNPVDTKIRTRGIFYPDGLPAVLGCDGAGVVEKVGSAVTRFKPGDEVWFCNGGLGGEQGNYAECTLVDESVAQLKPSKLSWIEAAAAPLVLLTAWEALFDRARLKAGQTLLVHAGAGGVGHIAVQMGRITGARVCTTVGSESKAAFVRDLGADYPIPYRETDFVAAVNDWTDGRGVDLAFDTVGGETFLKTIDAVTYGGDLVTLLEPSGTIDWKEARIRNLRISFELMLTPMLRDLPEARAHQGEILNCCTDWIDSGQLTIDVSRTLPLEDAATAHRLIEDGHVQGKLVLTIED